MSSFFQKIIDQGHHTLQRLIYFVEENPRTSYYVQGLTIGLILYFLYMEFNPKIGGIFLRPDSRGITRFRFKGILPVLKYPFQSFNFWLPQNWDLNFIMFSNFWAMVYLLAKTKFLTN